jgi:hypothetical protein
MTAAATLAQLASSGALSADTSGNVGIGAVTPVNPLTVGGNGITLVPTYATYLVNSYYDGAWRYVANGMAWGIGNNFNGVTNGVTIATTAVNAGGAGAALTWTPALNIDTSGNVLVGTTTTTGKFTSSQSSTSAPSVAARATSTSFASDVLQIYCARDTNNASYNYITASRPAGTSFIVRDSGNVLNANNSYGGLSDQRLKENITNATPKLEKLNQVRIVNFNMIGDDQKQIGVVAQELEQIFPSMVEEDQEGTKSVKYSVFVPILIKAIQELKAELDVCKAEIAALKGV